MDFNFEKFENPQGEANIGKKTCFSQSWAEINNILYCGVCCAQKIIQRIILVLTSTEHTHMCKMCQRPGGKESERQRDEKRKMYSVGGN